MGFGNDFIKDVDFGKSGGYKGIPTKCAMLNNALGGIQGGRYDLIGGNTGTGKSAYVDDKYILDPIEYILENPDTEFNYTCLLYSQEITKKKKLAKWATRYMFKKYNVIADWKKVLSFGENRVSDEMYQMAVEAAKYLDQIQKHIVFNENPINPSGIWHNVKKFMQTKGEVVEEEIVEEDGYTHKQKRFIPKNPKHIVSVVTDTLGLLKKEQDLKTKKQIIDKHSTYAVEFYRDLYKCLVVDVSQLNRAIGAIDRLKLAQVNPQLEDFKETGEPSENCDTAIALFNPDRYNILEYKDYSIKKMKSKPNTTGVSYRAAFILKNRNGDDMLSADYRFIGGIGQFDYLDPDTSKIVQAKNTGGFRVATTDEDLEKTYNELKLLCEPYRVL